MVGDSSADDDDGSATMMMMTTAAMTDDGTSSSGPADGTSTGMPGDSGSSTGTPAESGDSSTGIVEFALTSTAFEEGGGIPGIHHVNGGNQSPPLAWVGAPPETLSFGIFFHDMTIMFNHSAIWDIPADVTSLPQDVDHDPMPADVPGAVQCESWTGEFGYGGPGSASNFYTFTIYALDVETLPDVNENSSLPFVRTALMEHAIASTTLTGQSTGP